MLKVLLMSSGIYIMHNGAVLTHYPVSVPLLYANRCQLERDASELVQLIINNTPAYDVPAALKAHHLAMDPPYDWCVPRYRPRPSLVADNPHHFYWPPEPGSPMMVAIPRPPKRPAFTRTLAGKPQA